jgi:hypothetical protein
MIRMDCRSYEETKNHELIHIKQQRETLIVPWYVIYFLHFILSYLKEWWTPSSGGFWDTFWKAYRNIWFEKEAFGNEKNYEYLKNRKLYAWLLKINRVWQLK